MSKDEFTQLVMEVFSMVSDKKGKALAATAPTSKGGGLGGMLGGL